jgi:putative copper export protein
MDLSAWAYEALPKTLLYAALLLIVGAALSRWMASGVIRSLSWARAGSELDQALQRIGVVASSVAVAVLLLRAFLHTATVFGAPDALHWTNLRVIAFESRWGRGWRLQIVTACALMMSAFGIRLNRRVGWSLYTIAVVTLCAMVPRLGHGATSTGHLVLHILHLAAVSAWLGTFTVILWLYFRKWPRDSDSRIRDAVVMLLRRFSRIALPAAGLTIVTGVIAAAIYVNSFSDLLTTSYGRTLVVKIGGFAGVLVCGWSNWRRLRTVKAPRPQTLLAELAFAVLVVLVTGVLTETEHP